MELRESGMPEAAVWNRFFTPESTLAALGFKESSGDVADICAGYGTFTIAAAQSLMTRDSYRGRELVHAVDISAEMIDAVREASEARALSNVAAHLRDVFEYGTGLQDSSVGYAMLFNILHCERPEVLLAEAHRILRPGGLLAVTHWVSDRPTPRGPSADIRPTPDQCAAWAHDAGFRTKRGPVDLRPHHFGLVFERL